MEILLFALGLAVAGAVNVACFIAGARVCQKVAQGQPAKPELPKREKTAPVLQEQKEDDRERKRRETVLENIECYDGSPYGQKDVPM